MPAGWARAFWISLIMFGARVGGLREFDSLYFESGQLPILEPDTNCGEENDRCSFENLRNKYFFRPPNKRANFIKLAIASPFKCDWKILIRNWIEAPVEDFHVLRNKELLKTLSALLNGETSRFRTNIDFQQNYIVPVKLKIIKRGLAKRFGIICIPKWNDSEGGVVEPLRSDPDTYQRKRLRNDYKLLRNKMKNRKVNGGEVMCIISYVLILFCI